MPGHNNVGSGVDFKVIEAYSPASEAVQLSYKILWVKNNACADKAKGFLIENTRRDKVKLIGFPLVYNSMTCVVTAL